MRDSFVINDVHHRDVHRHDVHNLYYNYYNTLDNLTYPDSKHHYDGVRHNNWLYQYIVLALDLVGNLLLIQSLPDS